MALEVSCRRPLQVRAQFQTIKCGICGRQLDLEQEFSSRVRFSSRQCLVTNYPNLFMHLSPTLCNLITTDSILHKTLKKKDTRIETCTWSERNERRIENWRNIYLNERSEVEEIDRSVSQNISRNWDAVPFDKESFFYRIPNHGRSCIRRDIPWQLQCSGQR